MAVETKINEIITHKIVNLNIVPSLFVQIRTPARLGSRDPSLKIIHQVGDIDEVDLTIAIGIRS